MLPADTGSESSTAASIDVVWDRRDEWARRLQMIADARQFLHQSLFYLEYDEYGRAMVDALIDAQQRGVQVQLIIDSFGQRLGGVLMDSQTRRALRQALAQLTSAGGRVVWYRPSRRLHRWLGGGHHYKIQISEAGVCLLSSGNVTRSSFEGWNECALAINGAAAVRLLQRTSDIGGHVPEAHIEAVRAAGPPGDIPVDLWFCNPTEVQGPLGMFGSWRNQVTERLIDAIDSARRSLAITSFYFKPTPRLRAAIIAAARRGVEVDVFHSHLDALPATDLAWIAAAAHYPRLLEAGVRIHENRTGEHSKLVLVDDEWVACGSYNFEDAAHDRLAEVMVATRHAETVRRCAAIVEQLRRNAGTSKVSERWHVELSPRSRRRLWCFGRFSRYL